MLGDFEISGVFTNNSSLLLLLVIAAWHHVRIYCEISGPNSDPFCCCCCLLLQPSIMSEFTAKSVAPIVTPSAAAAATAVFQQAGTSWVPL
jgi:hypothetical protein